MFANALQPPGCANRSTQSCAENAAGRLHRPPKSPSLATLTPRCYGTGRAREGRKVRLDETHWSFIVDGPKKTPRKAGWLRGVEGVVDRAIDVSDYRQPSSNRPVNWWGRQACSCRGEGRCLCCRRFDRAIRAHQLRVQTAGGG